MNKSMTPRWYRAVLLRQAAARFALKLAANEDGATAIEYGLIASLIAVASIVAFGLVGTSIKDTFLTVASNL